MPKKPTVPDPATVSASEWLSAIGKKGGKARLKTMTAEERSAIAAAGGAARAKPTKCPRCQTELPTAREAWVHCRKPRKNKPSAKKGRGT